MIEAIIVEKEREEEYDQSILKQWKEARSTFFTHQLGNKLNQAKATEEEQQQIIKLFMEKQYQISQDKLGPLQQYSQQIQQLKKSLTSIQQKYQRLQRECPPMQKIINNKIDTLKVIHISYKHNRNRYAFQQRYAISAFELFKVVNMNNQLTEVIIKGVQIKQLQKFTNLLNRLIHTKPIQQKNMNELCWMKSFSPSKSLKLSINATIQLKMHNKSDTLSQINDLTFFRSLFYWLSDIKVQVELGKWSVINEWGNLLSILFQCIKNMRKLQIVIIGNWNDEIYAQSIEAARSVLFGGLTSFTEITQLQFNKIYFSNKIGMNDFLAIEQSLRTIFTNNLITYLTLYYCSNFPIFPKITTLDSIHLNYTYFRKQIEFMNEIAQNNPSLLSIKCYQITQDWRIDEKIFNQLQTLFINGYYLLNYIYLGNISSLSPSKVKYLNIFNSMIGRVDCLFMMFPKLHDLTCLSLSGVSFDHSLLSVIPSPHLEELFIQNNEIITDRELQVIDSKWPYLKSINLWGFNNIAGSAWSICKFKGLIDLRINYQMVGTGKKALQQLKRRGLIVFYVE